MNWIGVKAGKKWKTSHVENNPGVVRQGRTLQLVIRDAFGALATDSTGVNLVRRCRTLLFLDKFLKPTCLGYGIIMYTHP